MSRSTWRPARSWPDRSTPDGLEVTEVGDGNLNQVFLCRGDDGRTLVLKQALPYVRLVGPSWPMTEERAAREAHAIRTHAALSDRVCALTYYDEDNHVLALEDLTDHVVLRSYLNQGNDITGVPEILGRHVADISFGTSFLAVGEEVFRLAAADAVNTELCALTEDVIFTEPFLGSDRNSLQYPEAERFVADLQQDHGWIAGAMRCKRRFVTVAEALVHGDLHTGSVFVRFDGVRPMPPGRRRLVGEDLRSRVLLLRPDRIRPRPALRQLRDGRGACRRARRRATGGTP